MEPTDLVLEEVENEAADPTLQAWFRACLKTVDALTRADGQTVKNVDDAVRWARVAARLEEQWEEKNPALTVESVPRIQWVPLVERDLEALAVAVGLIGDKK